MWRCDRNRDGYIDREEAEEAEWTHRNPFEMDLNKDDRLSRLELCQRYARRRLLSQASGELVRKVMRTGSEIRPSERDKDERRDDYYSWRRRGSRYWLTGSVMSRFDLNRNGRLEQNEVRDLGIPFSQIDINQDREVSREELHALLDDMQEEAGDLSEGLPGWFFELDANRDRQVAMAEFATEWTSEKLQEFASLDTNGDGLLTVFEVSQSKAMVGGSYVNDDAQVLPPRKTVISEIEVEEDYLISDLDVRLSITHTHTSYLDAYLTGPDGQRVELFTEIGGEGDHFDQTIFDDQARYPIVKARPPYEGSFIPEALTKREASLSSFNGKSIKGVWQLVIRGTRNERFGMLHSWALLVKPQDDMLDTPVSAAPEDDDASEARPESDARSGSEPPPERSE
jgi:subtilisin-like proprotein convertase family protein